MGRVVPPAWPGSAWGSAEHAGNTLPERSPPVSPSGQSPPDREEQKLTSERCQTSELCLSWSPAALQRNRALVSAILVSSVTGHCS